MGLLRRLVNGLRDSVGPAAKALQQGTSVYGSAYAPAPPDLVVPEELRRAVDEENHREVALVTPRLARRIASDFPDAAAAAEVAHLVAEAANWERVQAAIVLSAGGDLRAVHDGAALATTDWRDVLVNADLANEDWPARLDAELGTT